MVTPHINPFLQPVVPTKGKQRRSERWTDEQFIQEAARAREEDRENTAKAAIEEWKFDRASETHFKDMHLLSWHEDADWKRMAEIHYFRSGSPTDRTINTFLKPIPGVNGSNYKGYREKLLDHFKDVQSQTVSYLLVSMKQLIDLVGKDEWDAATNPERKALLLRLFSKAKCTISRNCFKIESSAVDVENIFGRADEERKLWQNMVRTKFTREQVGTSPPPGP